MTAALKLYFDDPIQVGSKTRAMAELSNGNDVTFSNRKGMFAVVNFQRRLIRGQQGHFICTLVDGAAQARRTFNYLGAVETWVENAFIILKSKDD